MAILETISQLPFSSLLSQKKEVHYHATVSSKGQHVEKIANISYVLESCKNVAELKQVHASIFKCGGKQNIFLATKLIHLYSMFGSVDDACLLFNKMQNPDSFLWNTVIRACASNGLFQETLLMYKQMQCAGVKPDKFTFPFVIKACTGLLDLKEGSEIHELVLKNGLDSDFNAASGLINMYAKCGSIFDARKVFDKMTERNLVLWATMIAGYVEVGDGYAALELFHEMNLKEIGLDCGCILGGLRACGLIRALFEGKSIHAWIIRTGFESDLLVRAALVDMYVKCEILNVAHQLFDKMPNRNVAMWASMIAACAQSGYAKDAVEIFCEMQQAGMKPNAIILATVIPAFAHFGSLEQGKCIHAYAIRSGFESNTRIATAFIGMYAKCGSVEIARKVFDKISERDVVSWTAMIAGYGMHGHGEHALAVFNEMQEAGVKPDHVTFVSVLSACSRAGLLDKGWRCFDHMTRKFNIQPTVKHYACMVDLLGRAGRLVEAYKFIRKMQLEPYASVWGALLGACAIHCNVELAEHVAEHLYNLEPKNPSWYVLLSNVYAAAGRSDGQIKVTRMMESQGLRKLPGKR